MPCAEVTYILGQREQKKAGKIDTKARFSSILTSYEQGTNRPEICKLNKYNDDNQKHEKNETKPFHRITNPNAYTYEIYI